MITPDHVATYRGPAYTQGPDYVYLPPDPRLAPFIANYTLTCPRSMPVGYTILPTASATITVSTDARRVITGLRGINTQAKNVGGHASQFDLLLLIEFHTAALYPLLGIPQAELADAGFALADLSAPLERSIQEALLASDSIPALVARLDAILLAALGGATLHPQLRLAMEVIRESRGALSAGEVSRAVGYSEKQMGRLFRQHLGTGVKTFSRIVRVNHAMRLLESGAARISDVAVEAGYFDQPHLVHDFQALCGTSPQDYLRGMSLFYKDSFKL